MNKMKLCLIRYFTAIIWIFIISCGDDPIDLGPMEPVADFDFMADGENPFNIIFFDESINGEAYYWDFGDGNTSTEKSLTHTYEATGDYIVSLRIAKGSDEDTMTQTVSIESPGGIPTGPSVVNGGDMDDPDAWTVTASQGGPIDYDFAGGVLKLSGEAEPNQTHQVHIWQAIEVEAGQEYLFMADVKGSNFYFAYLEINLGPVAPEEGEQYDPEYPADKYDLDHLKGIDAGNSKVVGINQFVGCGDEPFEGNMIRVACDGPALETNGRITFPESGTYYLLIKAGTWNGSLGDGVTIDNIFLAPIVGEK